MSDTFITVSLIILGLGILFLFPVMAAANQNDAITESSIQAIVSDFVNTSAKEGKITQTNYDTFIQQLNATGNTYSVELEVSHLDDNIENKGSSSSNKDVIGENIYYSVFNNEIIPKIESNGVYYMYKGDYIKATVKNTNVTFGTQMKNFLYSLVGNDTIAIEVSESSLVTTTGKR